jgi:hypothetical protein
MDQVEALQKAAEYAGSLLRPGVALRLLPRGVHIEARDRVGDQWFGMQRIVPFEAVKVHRSLFELMKAEIDVVRRAVALRVAAVSDVG